MDRANKKPKLNHKTILVALGCTAALVLAAGAVQARPFANWDGMGGKGKGMPGKRGERLKSKLGLSDQQFEQIKSIHADQRARCQPYRQQLSPLRQQMKTLLTAETIDEAQVIALHAKMASLRQALAEQQLHSRLKVMRVLSKDQRIKMTQGHGKRGKRGKRGWGGKGGKSGKGGENGWGDKQYAPQDNNWNG